MMVPPAGASPDRAGSRWALDVDAETERQKTALLYRNAPFTSLATGLVASVLAFVDVRLHAPLAAGIAWWALCVAIASGRWLLARRFQAQSAGLTEAPRWRRLHTLGTAAAAICWGAGMVLFLWNAPEGARLFTGLIASGVVACAVPALAASPRAFLLFALSVLVPVSAVILWQAASMLDLAFGSMAVTFLLTVAGTSRHIHRSLDAAVRLGFEQSRLAGTLRASEERHRLMLQFSPVGILHFDRELVITFCNERFANMLHAQRDRVIGFGIGTLDNQRLVAAFRASAQGRDSRYTGEHVSALTGKRLWLDVTCTPFRGPDDVIEGGLAIVQDVTERYRSEQEIRTLAYFDPLTRLPNRRLLMDRLGHAIVTSERSGQFGALLIVDLDHFKKINDTQGHDVGDRMLIEVAQRLQAAVRGEDTVSRFGGDEFVVLLEDLDERESSAATRAEHIAGKLRASLEQPFVLGGSEAEYFSGASVGVTLFCGTEESLEALLKQADLALYQAKEAGRNAIRFFSPAMQASIDRRTRIETALRRALERGEFQLHYQPQVGADARITGAEALIRWRSPDRGLVPPAQFIPLAEESGLILPIGRWALDAGCAQLRAWEHSPRTSRLRLSVNVSARQFHQPDFVDQVRQSLLASGADPARLNLELTESAVLDDVETVVRRMREVNELGVTFSLDDFGLGYSSLIYLKRLPLDQVKIDRTFVRGLPGDSGDAAIVRAIIAMARSLGLKVIAEGVECAEQRDFLAQHGCSDYQGFLFGAPMPIAEFEAIALASPPVPSILRARA